MPPFSKKGTKPKTPIDPSKNFKKKLKASNGPIKKKKFLTTQEKGALTKYLMDVLQSRKRGIYYSDLVEKVRIIKSHLYVTKEIDAILDRWDESGQIRILKNELLKWI